MFALVALFLLPALIVVDSPSDAAHEAVDLAGVSQPRELPGALREDALLVAIQRDGSVWFGTKRIPPKDLPEALGDGLRRGAERKVYIRADARAKYGSVVEVLHSVRSAGVEHVAFVLEQRKTPTD